MYPAYVLLLLELSFIALGASAGLIQAFACTSVNWIAWTCMLLLGLVMLMMTISMLYISRRYSEKSVSMPIMTPFDHLAVNTQYGTDRLIFHEHGIGTGLVISVIMTVITLLSVAGPFVSQLTDLVWLWYSLFVIISVMLIMNWFLLGDKDVSVVIHDRVEKIARLQIAKTQKADIQQPDQNNQTID